MQVGVIASILSSVIIFGGSGSIICPSVFEKGIPFEVYGGPLYPVAIYREKPNKRFEAPKWAEMDKQLVSELLQKILNTKLRQCLHEVLPDCEAIFRNITQIQLAWYFDYLEEDDFKKELWPEFKMESWGTSGLNDLKNREFMLRRRTIVLMCLHWCHAILAMGDSENPMMKYYCPDPCKQPGLCMSPEDVRGSCHLTGEGFFHHQYACKCKPGSLYNAAFGACTVDTDPCNNKIMPKCFPEGTELCSFDRSTGDISCLCKPTYMGENCSVTADACEDHIRNPLLPNGGLPIAGNRACNINNDGNRCVPAIDPELGPTFSCICSEDRWTGDIALGFENCLKKVTNCDKLICIHGQCVDSMDGNEAICVCNEGYEGSPNCATFTGIWASWSPWGQCLPACGTERWALRSRKCLSLADEETPVDCHGPSVEFSACEPHICAPEDGVMISQYFGGREVTLQAVFILAAVTAVGLTLFWRYKVYPNLAVRIRLNREKPPEKNR